MAGHLSLRDSTAYLRRRGEVGQTGERQGGFFFLPVFSLEVNILWMCDTVQVTV